MPSDSLKAPQDHGGNRREVLERYGLHSLLDFSASINPLGHPEGLREQVQSQWEQVLHYPDRSAADLVSSLAARHEIAHRAILVGNGSSELLDLLLRALAPRRLVVCPPDFGLYESLAPRGTPVLRVPRIPSHGFAIDGDALVRELRRGDLLLLSNPASPSGHLTCREELRRLRDRCEQTGAMLAVDEAFADFCPRESVLGEAPHDPVLLVLRSLTKFYGIPGIRLGFLVAAPPRIREIAAFQVPWSVNALAQIAGAHCLDREDWEARTLAYMEKARTRLCRGLAALPGLRPLPSCVNYVLVEVTPPAPGAYDLFDALARRGILVRHCASFGLGDCFLRIAVRTVAENGELLTALEQIWEERQEAPGGPVLSG